MTKLVAEVAASQLRDDVPDFRPGDSVKVHVKVVEGNRSRIQVFAGVVLGRNGEGIGAAFTVRKVSFGTGVERIFPLHARTIEKVDIVKHARVRRAKLYFLRERKGKASRMKEKRVEAPAAGA